MASHISLADEARIAFDNIADLTGSFGSPGLRLGVTGLSRAGKTVFITALVHNFLHGGRLPLFEPYASGRVSGATLQPQPSMNVPRFQYEDHVQTLVEDREWPQSTRAISELRLVVEFESASIWNRALGAGRLNIDIVDYPGEWLLDLPLMGQDFAEWSRQTIDAARNGNRRELATEWLSATEAADPDAPADETLARELAGKFTDYLRTCRRDDNALSTLPPGRFLMPGDLEGSPALTFAPLDVERNARPERGSLHSLMADRYEAYKRVVVKPFFREHFARLDRQIVLVDALQAINAGPEALADLENALRQILACFRPGRGSWLAPILRRRIDRILFAATKADHLHRVNHPPLEKLLRALVARAIDRARFAGADVEVVAMAAIRATREARMNIDGEELPVIAGVPLAGETIDGTEFDGIRETAIFPGDLPANPEILLEAEKAGEGLPDLRFVRFRPPRLERDKDGLKLSLPHIRLDRALQFLLADRLA